MKSDLSEFYSHYYGKILTPNYRREFIRWLRDNNPAALNRVLTDHKLRLEDFAFSD